MSMTDANYEMLIAYAAGELAASEVAKIETQLRSDPEAAAIVALFRSTVQAVRTDRSEAPPEATLAAAKALYRRPVAAPSLFERLKRVLADLVYDSRSEVALVGVRGADTAYQLSYECSLAGVDVQVEPVGSGMEAGQRRLIGQVTLHTAGEFERVVLTGPGSEESVATAAVDAGGVFSLTAEPGNFDLWIALADTVVVVPGVEIR